MISVVSKRLAQKQSGPMALALGQGVHVGVAPHEGGSGSGRHRGARIYQSGNAYRALTPSGHNIGPYKDASKLKDRLDQNEEFFKLEPKQKQAISGTSQAPQLRAQESRRVSISEYTPRHFKKLRETDMGGKPSHQHIFQVILIEEGLGNFKDRYFYTKGALQSAAQTKLFEGAQSYADHPSGDEEITRPERSTRDILGYYENIQYQESDLGQGQLVANFCISDIPSLDWANSLLTNSIEYATKFKEKDLVGLSINASGAANPVSIDEFMQANQLAEPVLQKLMEAQSQGITEIQIVSELTDQESVDLVTKAGAGGRILKMLEQEKSMAKNKIKESETETHTEDGNVPPPSKKGDGSGDGATPDHADADQDQALFAKMIKQYLGKDGDQEEMQMAKHAYQAHRETGMDHTEAYEAAGKHLKMAMEIGKKMSQGAPTHESENESEAHEEAQSPPTSPSSSGKGAAPAERKKESMQVVKLAGEVAQLRESVKRYELRDYLEDKLKKCGKSNAVTKKFKEALGTPKSKEQIDSTWDIFIKAYEAGAEEVGDSDSAFFTEKRTHRESESDGGISFADCVR